MNTIVLGVDGSDTAHTATSWTVDIAVATGAQVVAVHAIPRFELWALGAVQIDSQPIVAEWKHQLGGAWTAPLRNANVPVTTQLVRGDPAAELLRVATETSAAMIVVGSTSHSVVHDLVVGGTAHKIINRSRVPVVLVPATAT
jgi:nucleotide-binding universal stress UspA family protein